MYVYQGEELGLPEVEDIPFERRQDPMWLRSGGVDPGRDGCRIPLPWTGDRPPYGFSREGADRAVARPARRLGAAHRRGRSPRTTTSMLALYRAGLALRRARPRGRADGALTLASRPPTPFSPSPAATASPASSTSARTPVELPAGADVLIASDELEGGALPQDTTVWLRQAGTSATRAPPDRTTVGQGKEGR